MNKKKVMKQNSQVKLFLDPELLSRGFRIEDLIGELQLEVRALGISAGTLLFQKLVEAEAEQLVGDKRYDRSVGYYPWGKQGGYGMLGGQKVRYEYPRVRLGRGQGEEVELKSYESFQHNDDRTRRVFAQLLANVSCRRYGKAIEALESGYGISKSVVSREVKKATEQELEALSARSLAEIDLLVMVIDGIEVDETVFIAALGVDRRSCQPRIADGSIGVRRAGRVKGAAQCREEFLWQARHDSEVPGTQDPQCNKLLVEEVPDGGRAQVARGLQKEGLEETLSVHRLELPEVLRKSFSTTNIIESAYSCHRHVTRNVKRWTNNNQKARWTAMALLEAERGFRRIKGYRSLPVLLAALEGKLTNFDENQKAA